MNGNQKWKNYVYLLGIFIHISASWQGTRSPEIRDRAMANPVAPLSRVYRSSMKSEIRARAITTNFGEG